VLFDVDAGYRARDPLYAWGFTEKSLYGESLTPDCEGEGRRGQSFDAWLIKFRAAQTLAGMSGAALLNDRTGRVCGMIRISKDIKTDLGGWAIRASLILENFPELRKLQKDYHKSHPEWTSAQLNIKLVMTARVPNNLPFTPLGNLLKGREDDLAQLDEQLRLHGSSAIVQPRAVSGPGGVGKTRLAVEYARRHQDDFTALLFVSANSPVDLASNVARLSADDGALHLTEYKSAPQPEQYAAVIRWLQQNKGWLLIFDNVDTKEAVLAVQRLVAKLTSGHVIVTSRITAWGGGIPRIPLGVLSADAAVALLIDKANSLARTGAQGARSGRHRACATYPARAARAGCPGRETTVARRRLGAVA
jgi:hypothetical protein